jgi:hypothetical protein
MTGRCFRERYGHLAFILVHFLYDLANFAVRYIDQAIERAQGNCEHAITGKSAR